MKSVLISIQPKWVKKIASGEKTIEVRKTRPKLETPFKCYIYCTEGDALAYPCINYPKFDIHRANNGTLKGRLMTKKEREQSDYLYANGKVIGEYVCDKVYDLRYVPTVYYGKPAGTYEEMICNSSCLSVDQIKEYAKGRDIYGWYISELKIYDKPKELSEFWTVKCTNKKVGCFDCKVKPNCIKTITRPPQSWCYVESLGE